MRAGRRKKKNNIGAIIVVVILMIGLAIGGYFLTKSGDLFGITAIVMADNNSSSSEDAPEENLRDSLEGIANVDLSLVEADSVYEGGETVDSVDYYINTTPSVEAEKSTLIVENPIGTPYYLAVELLEEDKTVIYRSGLIPAGYKTDNPKLNITAEPGEYAHIVVVSVVDKETLEVLGTNEHNVMLNVK